MASPRNVVLTGFMGVGKSTVGAAVAERMARPLVDMDVEIEARLGKPIHRVFGDDSERVFREHERALCQELAERNGLVIATGGGSLVDPKNRDPMAKHGTIVCLTCEIEELLRRLNGKPSRPLIDQENLRASVEVLLAKRGKTYASLPWHVDTTDRSVDEIVDEVVDLASNRTLTVRDPGGPYPIHLGPGLLPHLGDAVRSAGLRAGSMTVLVSNEVVFPLHGEAAAASLAAAGYPVESCVLPDGERHKSTETVLGLYDALVRHGLDRHGAVIGLGGGVTGDVAGFAAATYLRGVRYVHVPTTLLAMVDASVGGKTGVDLPAGKNLVGAFKQPDLVLIDPRVLATLSEREIHSGLAEMLKHGIIGDPSLLADVADGMLDEEDWTGYRTADLIERALRVKIAVVEEDPFEHDRRAVLNLGHTVAHALEVVSRYTLRHGDAVAIGLVAAARIAIEAGVAQPELVESIERVLKQTHLPISCPPHAVDEIVEAMSRDKKRAGDEIRWVLPRTIGHVTTGHVVPEPAICEVLIAMGARRNR